MRNSGPAFFGTRIVTCSELTAYALRVQVKLDEYAYALPIKKLKGTEPVESLDLSNKHLGAASAIVIASLIGVNVALTSVELRGNQLGDEGWGAIFAAICGNKDSKIMSLDASCEHISPDGVQLIAEALRTSFTGGLTKISLAQNDLEEEGTKAICEALKQNKTLKELDLSGLGRSNIGRASGAKHVADMLGVNCALTELSIYGNHVGDEGVGAICEAIQSNKETKLASLNLGFNSIHQVGAKYVEAMVAVTGRLTVTNLLGNQLDAEPAKLLAEVAKKKGISLCGIQRDQTTADFSYKTLKPSDAILLLSDLSQAVVTGTLTECNIRGNFLDSKSAEELAKIGTEKGIMLFGIKRDQKEANFANLGLGPADAILISSDLVIGALTVANLLGNRLDAESAKTLAEVAKQKGISLCGIQRDQTTADFFGKGLQPPDAILLASDLSQAVVTGSLTVANLLCNRLDAESAKTLAEVAKQKGISLCGIQRDQTTADFFGKGLQPPDAILLASDLSQAVVTCALTHLSLVDNIKLGDEGVEALSVAIGQSISLSKLDLSNSVSSTMFGPKGAAALAKALAINSSLTQIEYAPPTRTTEGGQIVASI